MKPVQIEVKTTERREFVDVTYQIGKVVSSSGVKEGICVLWVPHTTAAITVNENADPDVQRDMLFGTGRFVPPNAGYHHSEGNSDSHILSSLFSPSLTLIITDGKLLLGTWQGIYFSEFDGPRNRRMFVKVQGD
jgi:secondary thiamine-phosphate synthase enzyme